MTSFIKVHYVIADAHIDSEDAFATDGSGLARLVRKMSSEEDVVYCYPEWCSGERVVFWGCNGEGFVLEFQKSGEAMLYTRKFAATEVIDVVERLRDLWDEPLSNGFSMEQY